MLDQGCHGRASSKIRASHLKKKIHNQSINERMKTLINHCFPAPWCMWQFFRRPARLQSVPRRRHGDVTTSPPSPPPPTPSRRRARISPRLRPPPRRQLAGCPPLWACPGSNPGHCQSMCGQRRHTAGGVWAKRMVLWWTGSMKHPRRWRAFFTISALRPSTGQRCDL